MKKKSTAKTPKNNLGNNLTLKKWNLIVSVLFFVQAFGLIIASHGGTRPIELNFLAKDMIASQIADRSVVAVATHTLFSINLTALLAVILVIPAISHLVQATIYRKRFEAEHAQAVNKARWIEYSLGASLLFVAVGLMAGVYDLATIGAIVGLSITAHIVGLAMELHRRDSRQVSWITFILGGMAGLTIWKILFLYAWGTAIYGSGQPLHIWILLATVVVFCLGFASLIHLQFRQKGKFADYAYAERAYTGLSLIATSAVVWQIFASSLR